MAQDQFVQESKCMSQNLQNSYYTTLRNKTNTIWHFYDKNATAQIKDYAHQWSISTRRAYCSKTGVSQDLSKKDKLKKAIKEYGSTILLFHISISLISLGAFYFLVSREVDVIGLLESFGYSPSVLKNNVAAGASSFVIAYAVHKIFAPVRISITLGAAPFIVKYFRSKGVLNSKHNSK